MDMTSNKLSLKLFTCQVSISNIQHGGERESDRPICVMCSLLDQSQAVLLSRGMTPYSPTLWVWKVVVRIKQLASQS